MPHAVVAGEDLHTIILGLGWIEPTQVPLANDLDTPCVRLRYDARASSYSTPFLDRTGHLIQIRAKPEAG